MRLEIFVLGLTAFFVYNAYTDGKYTKYKGTNDGKKTSTPTRWQKNKKQETTKT